MALDPLTYPAPVPNREGPAPGGVTVAGGAVGAPPRFRSVPFATGANVNTRSTSSKGPLKGPALIQGVYVCWQNASDPPNEGVEIGIATSAVTENLVALSTPKSWRQLFDPDLHGGYGITAAESGIFGSNFFTNAIPFWFPMNCPVPEAEFYLVISVWSKAAVGTKLLGAINLLEGVSPGALANFL